MNILYAASQVNIIEAAHAYLDANVSIIPLVGKLPSVAWNEFRQTPPARARVRWWLQTGKMQNIGIVLGTVSGGLVVLDVDDPEAVTTFERTFPEMANTMTVQTSRGRHYYWYTMCPPNHTIMCKPYELRSNGAYIVAPPSVHPKSGQPYKLARALAPRRLDNLNELEAWINKCRRGATVITPYPQNAVKEPTRFASAALDAEAAAVRTAPQGTANHTLNRAAYKLGQLVAAGAIDRVHVEAVLAAAASALTARDGERATLRTIRSGLEAGMRNPRGAA